MALLVAGASGSAFPQSEGELIPQSITVEFSEEGIAQISAELLDGTPVEVMVKNTPITPESFPYEPEYPEGNWAGWGAWWGDTNHAITAMKVKVGDKDLRVNLSAYSDLASAHKLMFEDTSIVSRYTHGGTDYQAVDRGSFRLIVWGGDAGVAYTAQLEFSLQYLERRAVWLGEFPTAVREVTVYSTR